MSAASPNYLRETPRVRRSTQPSSAYQPAFPLISAGTFTFIASWRGQLLICTIVLAIGAVWFIVRTPLERWQLGRRERLRKRSEKELISMEDSAGETQDSSSPKAKEKPKEKKKDVAKKRKGSVLRLPESIVAQPPIAKASGVEETTKASDNEILSAPAADNDDVPRAPAILLRAPTQEAETSKTPAEASSTRPSSPNPWDIPLPASPLAGPSRLAVLDSSDAASASADETHSVAGSSSSKANGITPPKSDGWSIIPEEGYLPASYLSPAKKKKNKAKSKGTPPPAALLNRTIGAESSIRPPPASPSRTSASNEHSSTRPSEPSKRHSRRVSEIKTGQPEFDVILEERDRLIDSLRAEIGLAKAEEARAREGASKAKAVEDSLRQDIDRIRRSHTRADNEARRREAEMTNRLGQLSQMYSAAIGRLNALESIAREAGRAIPPPTPSIPMTIPPHILAQQSPLPPPSPYNAQFTPSPITMQNRNPPMYHPYPSPGMYPSPMLHPHYPSQPHSHSPSPYRRASTTEDGSLAGLAGPLTPGMSGMVPSPSPSGIHTPYPSDMGMGLPNGGLALPAAQNGLSAADLRRMSIESSVMKKKPARVEDSDSGDSREPIAEGQEGSQQGDGEKNGLNGLGIGAVDRAKGTSSFTGPVIPSPEPTQNGTSDRARSPSPQSKAQDLAIPPGNGKLECQDTEDREREDQLSDGSLSSNDPENPSTRTSITEPRSLPDLAISTNVAGVANAKELIQSSIVEAQDWKDENFQPMFASIAHTPAQTAEIARLSEMAMRRTSSDQRGRGSSPWGLATPPTSQSPGPRVP